MASGTSTRREVLARPAMFSVTFHEGALLLAILAAVLLGVSVKHWRDARRERPVAVQVSPAPEPR